MVYDYLLNLPDEVELIWRSPWTAVKILFLFSRYLPFLELVPLISFLFTDGEATARCALSYHTLAWMEFVGLSFAVALLAVRTWAVWNKSLIVGVALLLAFISCTGASMALTSFFLTAAKFIPLGQPYNMRCIVTTGEKLYLTTLRAVILVYDTGTLILMLWKGISQYSFRDRASALEKAVYTDGLMYFVFLFCHTVTSVFLMRFLPFQYINLTTVLDRNLHSILACRVILHIRREHQSHAFPESLPHWEDIKTIISSQAEDQIIQKKWDRQTKDLSMREVP